MNSDNNRVNLSTNTNDFDIIMERLETFDNMYPNVVTLWTNYIKQKNTALKNSIANCHNMLNDLEQDDTLTDLDYDTIITLYALNNIR